MTARHTHGCRCRPTLASALPLIVLGLGATLAFACGEPRGGHGYPLATFVCHNPLQVGAAEPFDASASSDDGIIQEYAFDFGDGTPVLHSSGPTVVHRFEAEGSYTVQLDVVDELGNVAFERRVVRATTAPPTCSDRCAGHMRCVDGRCRFSPAECREGDADAACVEGLSCCGGYCEVECG